MIVLFFIITAFALAALCGGGKRLIPRTLILAIGLCFCSFMGLLIYECVIAKHYSTAFWITAWVGFIVCGVCVSGARKIIAKAWG